MSIGSRVAAGLLPGIFFLQGCATVALPPYNPGYDNVTKAKAVFAQPVDVGAFTGGPAEIAVRGTNKLKSPVGSGFADFVQSALTAELRRAEKLATDSRTRIQGTLVEANGDAGVSTGSGKATVEFVVTNGTEERYRKRISGNATWPSQFMADMAISRAAARYQTVFADVFMNLYSDPEFKAAVTR